jgi:hypothetical protein
LHVVDLNPRINGSTPFLLLSEAMQERGFSVGSYHPGVSCAGSQAELLERTQRCRSGEAVVLSCVDGGESVRGHIAAFAESAEGCRRVLREVLASRAG